MKTSYSDSFDPSKPEMLAAYLDGEFEGCPTLADKKRAVEEWIDRQPEAVADLTVWRRLKQYWQSAAPAEPDESSWQRVRNGIGEGLRRNEAKSDRSGLPWGWVAGGGAAAAAILLALFLGLGYGWMARSFPTDQNGKNRVAKEKTPNALFEEFEVATSEEIEILRVEGDDTPALNVAFLPFDGQMQLAEVEDVSDVDMQSAKNEMKPQMVTQSARPMIWAGGGLGE